MPCLIEREVRNSGGRGYTISKGSFIHLGGPLQDRVTTGSFSASKDPQKTAMWLRRLVEV